MTQTQSIKKYNNHNNNNNNNLGGGGGGGLGIVRGLNKIKIEELYGNQQNYMYNNNSNKAGHTSQQNFLYHNNIIHNNHNHNHNHNNTMTRNSSKLVPSASRLRTHTPGLKVRSK